MVGVTADIRNGQRTVLVGTDLGRVVDSSRLAGTGVADRRTADRAGDGAADLVDRRAHPAPGGGPATRRRRAERRRAGPIPAAGAGRRGRDPFTCPDPERHARSAGYRDQPKQRQFVGDAAHELRSPIASLRVQLEVAQRLEQTEAMRELTDDALLDVDRLSHLIDDLLTLARSDEHGPGPGPAAGASWPSWPASVVAGYREARVPVRYSAGCRLSWSVLGDRDGLHRVLVNLIDNAVRYACILGTRLAFPSVGRFGRA